MNHLRHNPRSGEMPVSTAPIKTAFRNTSSSLELKTQASASNQAPTIKSPTTKIPSPYSLEAVVKDPVLYYLAKESAYKPSSKIGKKFQDTVNLIADKLIKNLPADFQVVEAKQFMFNLLSSNLFNAHTIPNWSGKSKPISFSKEVLNVCLNSASPDILGVDVLASILCHELMHNVYFIKYPKENNSKIQETFCDQVASTLYNAGFNPDAMNKVYQHIATLRSTEKPSKDSYDSVYLTDNLREEAYQKSSFPFSKKVSLLRENNEAQEFKKDLNQQLTSISNEIRGEQIEDYFAQHLSDHKFSELTAIQKISFTNNLLKEHQDWFLRQASGLSELQTLLKEIENTILSENKSNNHLIEYNQEIEKFGFNLYKLAEYHDKAPAFKRYYHSLAKLCCAEEDFPTFRDAKLELKNFLNATTNTELANSIDNYYKINQKLQSAEVYLYPSSFVTQDVKANFSEYLTPALIEELKLGTQLALPYSLHERHLRELQQELLNGIDNSIRGKAENDYRLMQAMSKIAGIDTVISELHVKDSYFYDSSLDPEELRKDWKFVGNKSKETLTTSCNTDSMSAFSIGLDGIKLEYPYRYILTEAPGFAVATNYINHEADYLRFMSQQSLALVTEVKALTAESLAEFVAMNQRFLLPSVSLFAPELAKLSTGSLQLAQVFTEKVNELREASTDPAFIKYTNKIFQFNLRSDQPLTDSKSYEIYRKYHIGVLKALDQGQPVIDSQHPYIKYIKEQIGKSYTPEEALGSIMSLATPKLGLTKRKAEHAEKIIQNLTKILAPEIKLLDLLGIDLKTTPKDLLAGVIKLDYLSNTSDAIYQQVEYGQRNASQFELGEIRSYYLLNFLKSTDAILSPKELLEFNNLTKLPSTFKEQCEELINQKLSAYTTVSYLNGLDNNSLVEHYQLVSATNYFYSNPKERSIFENLIQDRILGENNLDDRDKIIKNLIYPRGFQTLDSYLPALVSFVEAFVPANTKNTISGYFLNTTNKKFEDFVVAETVEMLKRNVKSNSGQHRDNNSPQFESAILGIIQDFEKNHFHLPIRKKILTKLADQLITQEKVSYLIKDNLSKVEKGLEKASSIFDLFHNLNLVSAENANKHIAQAERLVDSLRNDPGLRQAIFTFLSEPLTNKNIEAVITNLNRKDKSSILTILGDITGHKKLTDVHPDYLHEVLLNLHLRFTELQTTQQGFALAIFAHGAERQTATEFQKFQEEVIFPQLFNGNNEHQALVKDFVTEYFNLYGDNVYQKYVVACSLLVAKTHSAVDASEILVPEAYLGRVIREFLKAHGNAGDKLSQKIHSYPDTPLAMADQMAGSKSNASYLTRWDYFDQLKKNGPEAEFQGSKRTYVGEVFSGSMCVSSKLRYQDGSETQIVLLRPGAREESMLWLGKFEQCLENLSIKYPFFKPYIPLVIQTKELIQFETDFEAVNIRQQELAELAYRNLNFQLPNYDLVIRPVKLYRSANVQTGPASIHSGYKETEFARGVSYNQYLKSLRAKGEEGQLKDSQIELARQISHGILVAQVSNDLAIRPNNQDLHGDNLKFTIRQIPGERPVVDVQLFDFGCIDPRPVTEAEKHAVSDIFFDTFNRLSLLKGDLSQQFVTSFARKTASYQLSNVETPMPYLGGLPMSYLALGDFFKPLTYTAANSKIPTITPIMTIRSFLSATHEAAERITIDHNLIQQHPGLKFKIFTKLIKWYGKKKQN